MPYTLVKFLLWFGLAALIGMAIGWALCRLRCRGEIARLRSQPVGDAEIGRLRRRVSELEAAASSDDSAASSDESAASSAGDER